MSETNLSVSETLEKHVLDIIKNLESQIPLYIKSFSDITRESMKFLENTYDISYAIENKTFGNFGLDEKTIKLLDSYLEINSKLYTSQIKMSNEILKNYLSTRLSMMESYNKFLSEFTTNIKSNKNTDKK